jgi:hypothetical protein
MGRPSVTAPGQPSAAGGPRPARVSAWAPFRHRLFAAMWGGQFVSNIGGWMQTVAAQWLMLSLTTCNFPPPGLVYCRPSGHWLVPAVMVNGRTGVCLRGESRGSGPRVRVAWIPHSPAGTV